MRRSEVSQAFFGSAVELDLRTVAARQAAQFIEGDPFAPDHLERQAAVEQLLTVPAPRALPEATGIDLQGVQRDHERPQAAERRIRLGVKLLGQGKEALHGVGRERLAEAGATLGGGKCDQSLREGRR